jgi:hypothetical protein
LTVRLERGAASVDNPAGEHWQASLSQLAVERLRAAAGQLAP